MAAAPRTDGPPLSGRCRPSLDHVIDRNRSEARDFVAAALATYGHRRFPGR